MNKVIHFLKVEWTNELPGIFAFNDTQTCLFGTPEINITDNDIFDLSLNKLEGNILLAVGFFLIIQTNSSVKIFDSTKLKGLEVHSV